MARLAVYGEYILSWFLLLFISSCSILEDRGPCPCFLTIDYTVVKEADPVPGGVYALRIYQPEVALVTSYGALAAPDQDLQRVPKAMSRVVAVFHNRPLRDVLEAGTVVTWEEGNAIDSVFTFSGEVDCTGEEAYCRLTPYKQFSTLTFEDGSGGTYLPQYNLVVRGTTCGFDAATMEAVEGAYLADVQETADGGGIVRIPRQKDASLRLELWTKDDKTRVFTAPVGAYLFEMGYDPSAQDLPDYHVRIDFRQAQLYIRVADWEEEGVFLMY